MKELPAGLAILIILAFISCQPEEERITSDPAITLRFSKDTVLFDTVFVDRGSITKRLKVYNDRNNAINIQSLRLGGGNNSPYTIYVNGIAGKVFEDQVIFGHDSLLVLVEVFIDPNSSQMPFVVEDSVIFETTANPQDVKLLAWGQNANFLNDSILACNTTWTKDLPFVIVNSVLVDANCSLTIEQGSQVYFHNNSALFVAGELNILGSPDQKIVLTNDRLDAPYNATPGQWEGVIFLEGSSNNKIDHAIIKNSVYGIWLGTPDNDSIPDLEVSNTVIENISKTGIITFTSDLSAYNVLINNCGEFVLANIAGGNYWYSHLTLANLGFKFFRDSPAVLFTDQLDLSDGTTISEELRVNFTNSIIWGNLTDEIQFDFTMPGSLTLFHHNLLRTEEDTFNTSNLINLDPLFINAEFFNYKLDSLSPAIDAGILSLIINDIEGNPRDGNPDLGAYEYKK